MTPFVLDDVLDTWHTMRRQNWPMPVYMWGELGNIRYKKCEANKNFFIFGQIGQCYLSRD